RHRRDRPPASVSIGDQRPEHGHERRSEDRGGEHKPDLDRVEAKARQADRDDDGQIAVRERPENSGDEELLTVGGEPGEWRRRPPLDHAPGPATLRDQWQTGTRPRGHSAVEVLGLEPAQAQALGGAIAPRAAPAHRQYDLLLRYLRQARLDLIDEALRRLERGEYGRCVICGKEIPEARLDLVPETPYCVEDAEREQQSSPR